MWMKISENDFELAKNTFTEVSQVITRKIDKMRDHKVTPDEIHLDNYHYESHRIDDLPLTLMKDPGPGIKYSYTENSEFAKDAEKAPAVGIDSFGEQDTFSIEEADDHQDFRNRKQNSDLSQRFYTKGLNIDNKDLHH